MHELNIKNFIEIISSGESETVEFKESFGNDAIETTGAFSNTRGGILFIGVKDSGEICGIKTGKKTLEDIAHRINEVTDPRLHPSISLMEHEGKNLIVVQISSVLGAPISVRGRYYQRSGRTNQRMSHEEIMQRMISSVGLSWDAFPEPTATYDDLDANLIDRFIKSVGKLGRRPVPEQTSNKDLLRKMDLVRDGQPTRAALLLFGKKPESYFPAAFVKLGRFRSPTIIVDDREVHGALLDQLEDIMSWFKERLETAFEISGKPERDVLWEYPLGAIREAVINVLCHRDYTGSAHSQIRLYDDRLEIWNAGGLPSGLTTDMLLDEHDSIPRNRKLADAFFAAGLIERWGSGTTRMAAELKEAGMPPPEFNSSNGRFRLIFHRQLFTEARLKDMGLSERQIFAVNHALEHGMITNSEYQIIAGVSKRTATRDLNELKSKGIFIIEGGGHATVYRLATT